ncbi:MAG: hypothetical protein MUE90_05175 [Thermoanaerobaculales bacterium]|nr:hypothetical protein [Thermoanaerobaculales bacterium]
MTNGRQLAIAVTAVALGLAATAPPAAAGGRVGLRLGGDHVGLAVGVGDWGLYSGSWSDPSWSLDVELVLGGYGEWVAVDGLGRCWRPWVASSWRPYTHGRWVLTSLGWTWVAYEPWGYLPHHYGSWAYAGCGWVWVPGFSYAAANVVWVRSGGFLGWYARPPLGWSHAAHGFSHGYRHGFADGYHSGYGDGYADGWRDARYGTWVDWRHFGSDNVARYEVNPMAASRHRVAVGTAAPTAGEISERGGGRVLEAPIETRTARLAGREVMIARPTGVAASIERHAPETVRSALSQTARERRQPEVRADTLPSLTERRRNGSELSAHGEAGRATPGISFDSGARGRAPSSAPATAEVRRAGERAPAGASRAAAAERRQPTTARGGGSHGATAGSALRPSLPAVAAGAPAPTSRSVERRVDADAGRNATARRAGGDEQRESKGGGTAARPATRRPAAPTH